MLELSQRLKLIASFVSEGSSVCDVGTDHGYLPAFLYLSGKYKNVVATDINQKPLDSARKNLARLGAQNVKLVLCDGLEKISRKEADNVIIAGMGGEVISGIIDRTAFLRDNTVSLILQPTTAAKELREYLSKKGFIVEREQPLQENGKIYSIMKVRFSGVPYTLSNTQAVIGVIKPDCDEAVQYIQKQYNIALKCAKSLESVLHKQKEYNYYLKLSEDLKNILGG